MKILHLISSIDPKSGGPTRSITGLCRGLAGCGVDVHLFSASPRHDLSNTSGVKFYKGSGCGLRKTKSEVDEMIRETEPDIIHLHGLWMPVNYVFCSLAQHYNIPLVQSIRGMLDPWALEQKALKKKIAFLLYQRRDLRYATCLHATADQEKQNIRARGFLQPIVVIPNGVDLPNAMPSKSKRADGRKTALFLSRLHPGKGLLDLVRAWAVCKPLGWVMRVVGPDVCGHKADVIAEIKKLEVNKDFEFVGELNDAEKWQEYVNADLFVHPSHSENFGISIAEALAAGVPVITTKGTPWAELRGEGSSARVAGWFKGSIRLCPKGYGGQVAADAAGSSAPGGAGSNAAAPLVQGVANENNNSHLAIHNSPVEPSSTINYQLSTIADGISNSGRCGWWIDIGVEPLAEALREAMGLSDEDRRTMGENGRKLVDAKYTWPAIAEQMKSAYDWILSGGDKPDCVDVL